MLTQDPRVSQAVSVPRGSMTQRKTIQDVAKAARDCRARTGRKTSLNFSVHFEADGQEHLYLNANRGDDAAVHCSLESAIAFFGRDIDTIPTASMVADLPTVADIVCGPNVDVVAALKRVVKATINEVNQLEQGVAPECTLDLSHEVVAVDVTIPGDGDNEEQYDWRGHDDSYKHELVFVADFFRLEHEADRVLAFYRITVSPVLDSRR